MRQRIGQLEDENSRLKARDAKIESQTSRTTDEVKTLRATVDTSSTPASFGKTFGEYLGSHQFTLAGAAAGDFIYDRQSGSNSFALTFEPIILYRVNDWLLFGGTIKANLANGSSADFQLPVADAHIFLNDYIGLVRNSHHTDGTPF